MFYFQNSSLLNFAVSVFKTKIMSNKTLVLGASGKTGRRVLERLKNQNIPSHIGSRSAMPPFDWDNAATWPSVLAGIDKVYISFQPDLAVPQAAAAIQEFVVQAKKAGVQKLVLLSGRGEKEAEQCEDIVKQSGLDWTIVRASWFMQNFSENFLLDSILTGQVVIPEVKAKEPFVDADDIADVVVEALTNDLHSGKTYSLTGPELLSFEQATSFIAEAINKPLQFSSVSIEEYTTMLRSYQLSEDFIWLIQYLFTTVLDGRNEFITQDVEMVLKRKPTSFTAYIAKTNATGIWNNP